MTASRWPHGAPSPGNTTDGPTGAEAAQAPPDLALVSDLEDTLAVADRLRDLLEREQAKAAEAWATLEEGLHRNEALSRALAEAEASANTAEGRATRLASLQLEANLREVALTDELEASTVVAAQLQSLLEREREAARARLAAGGERQDHGKQAAVEAALTAAEARAAEAEARVDALTAQHQLAVDRAATFESTLNARVAVADELRDLLGRERGQTAAVEQRLADHQTRIEDLGRELAETERRAAAAVALQVEATERRAGLETQLAESTAATLALTTDLEQVLAQVQEVRGLLDREREQTAAAEQRNKQLQQELADAGRYAGEAAATQDEVRGRETALEKELAEITAAGKDLELKLAEVDQRAERAVALQIEATERQTALEAQLAENAAATLALTTDLEQSLALAEEIRGLLEHEREQTATAARELADEQQRSKTLEAKVAEAEHAAEHAAALQTKGAERQTALEAQLAENAAATLALTTDLEQSLALAEDIRRLLDDEHQQRAIAEQRLADEQQHSQNLEQELEGAQRHAAALEGEAIDRERVLETRLAESNADAVALRATLELQQADAAEQKLKDHEKYGKDLEKLVGAQEQAERRAATFQREAREREGFLASQLAESVAGAENLRGLLEAERSRAAAAEASVAELRRHSARIESYLEELEKRAASAESRATALADEAKEREAAHDSYLEEQMVIADQLRGMLDRERRPAVARRRPPGPGAPAVPPDGVASPGSDDRSGDFAPAAEQAHPDMESKTPENSPPTDSPPADPAEIEEEPRAPVNRASKASWTGTGFYSGPAMPSLSESRFGRSRHEA